MGETFFRYFAVAFLRLTGNLCEVVETSDFSSVKLFLSNSIQRLKEDNFYFRREMSFISRWDYYSWVKILWKR